MEEQAEGEGIGLPTVARLKGLGMRMAGMLHAVEVAGSPNWGGFDAQVPCRAL